MAKPTPGDILGCYEVVRVFHVRLDESKRKSPGVCFVDLRCSYCGATYTRRLRHIKRDTDRYKRCCKCSFRHGKARIGEDVRHYVRKLHSQGFNGALIAELAGVCKRSVYRILDEKDAAQTLV